MTTRTVQSILAAAAILAVPVAQAESPAPWQSEFGIGNCTLQTTGRNPYFILEPGHQRVLEGGDTKVQITVLDDTKTVNGVLTRVVEEKEWKGGAGPALRLFAVAQHDPLGGAEMRRQPFGHVH